MPKQVKSNPFMIFAAEWRLRNNRRESLQQCIGPAGEVWQTMSPQQREIYKKRAKEDTTFQPKPAKKLTCTGTPISVVDNKEKAEVQQLTLMQREIYDTVRNSVERGELADEAYYFIGVNYFVKTMNYVYIPAEISVSQYSLKEGNMRLYHTYLNPTVNLYALQFDAQQHVQGTHRLPLPPDAMGTKDMCQVFYDIIDFMQSKDAKGNFKPLYTRERDIEIVKSALQYLQDESDTQDIVLKVYPIELLFHALREACSKLAETPVQTVYANKAAFDRDYFEYQAGISCDYHEGLDLVKYCTTSLVTRWGFMISDYNCESIAITKIKGRHCPVNTKQIASDTGPIKENDDDFDTQSCITASSRSSKSYKTCDASSTASAAAYYSFNKPIHSKWRLEDDDDDNSKSKVKYAQSNKSAEIDIQRSLKTLDEETDVHNNPWAERSKQPPPRMPTADNFDVSESFEDDCRVSVVSGTAGRGRMLRDNYNNAMFDVGRDDIGPGASGYSRGRGRGRGALRR